MPALGININQLTSKVLELTYLKYNLNDNYEGEGTDEFYIDTLLVQNIKPRLTRGSDGQYVCELYEFGTNLIASFSTSYPANVQNSFNGETDPERIRHLITDLIQNL